MAEVEKLDFQLDLNGTDILNFLDFLKLINYWMMNHNVKNIDIHLINNFNYTEINGLNDQFKGYPILKHALQKQKSQIDTEDLISLLTIKSSSYLYFTEVKNAYDKIYKPVFQNKSLRDLIVESLGNQNEVYIEILTEKTSEIYTQLQATIKKASELYNEINFESNHSKYSSLEGLDEINLRVKIEEFISTLENLSIDLKESKKIYINDQIAAFNKEYKEIFEAYLSLKISFESHCIRFGTSTPLKPGLLNFSSKDSEAFNSFNDLRIQSDNLGKSLVTYSTEIKHDYISILEIEAAILKFGKLLNKWNDIVAEKIHKNLKRFNPFHSLKSFVVTIEEIQALYVSINDLKIFQKEFTVNTQNLTLIIENLQQNIVELKEYRKYLTEYAKQKEWLKFYKNLEPSYKFQLQELLSFSSVKWSEIFEFNFKLSFIESMLHPCIIDLDSKGLRTLDEIQNIEMDILTYKYREKLQRNLNDYLVNTKTNIDKINKQLSSGDMLIENLNDEIAPINIKPGYSSSNGLISLTIYFQTGEKQNIEVNIEDRHLKVNSEMIKEITHIPIADRYSVASALAMSLILFNDEFKVFQTKNSNIVSLLPDKINEQILSILNDKGIKEIRVQDNKRNLLIESILMENKKSILLLNDGLINGMLVDDYYYQKEIINAFEKIGFQVRNLLTYELFVNKFMVFDELLKDIH